jgi:3-isopropylmalate/(R)-2-methylmalate dehydratase small subunit
MTTNAGSQVTHISGTAVAVRGDDLDTDRIIPARFLKAITFDGLEAHLFEDARLAEREQGRTHALDLPAHKGARVMLVQSNFGCGSSREHAPQAIARAGFQAIVGESFAEIFFGNSLMMGLPCVSASPEDVQRLMRESEAHPDRVVEIDLVAKRITAGAISVPMTMPEAARGALLSGDWDATAALLDRYDEVERVKASLPYIADWGVARA